MDVVQGTAVGRQGANKVLVMESRSDTREQLSKQLLGSGFQVELTTRMDEAYQALMLSPGAFAMVLVSLEDVGEHIYPFIHRIKQLPTQPALPILLLCDNNHTHAISRAIQVGAEDYLTRPLRPIEVHTRIERAWQVFQLKQTLHRQHESQQQERKAASELQQSLLPKSPFQRPDITISWTYRPYDQVGGDMLNVFPLGPNMYGFYVADVCGHGTAAAMMSVWLSHTLQPPRQQGPAEINRTSEAFSAMMLHPAYTCAYLESKLADVQHDVYLTMVYGIIDTESRRLVYARCGHPFPMIQRANGTCEVLEDPGGPAIGMGLGIPFTEHVVHYQPGDRIFFYSDGLMEAESPKGELYGIERCIQTLQQTHQQPVDKQINTLIRSAAQFQQSPRFADDITVMGLTLS
jgi:sigma-B regulation protein RsbU (phosphoserine phosphatase)